MNTGAHHFFTARVAVPVAIVGGFLGVVGLSLAAITGAFSSAPSYTLSLLGNRVGQTVSTTTDTVSFMVHANQAQQGLRLGLAHDTNGLFSGGAVAQLISVSGKGCDLNANDIRCSIPAGRSAVVTATYPTDDQGETGWLFTPPNAKGDALLSWTEPQL